MTAPETFGARLRRLREAKRWSREKLSEKSGVERHVIWNLEEDRHDALRLINVASLSGLARALSATLDYLATGTDPAAELRADLARVTGERDAARAVLRSIERGGFCDYQYQEPTCPACGASYRVDRHWAGVTTIGGEDRTIWVTRTRFPHAPDCALAAALGVGR